MDKYLITLAHAKELGPVSLNRLLNRFGTAKNIWEASVLDLKAVNLPEKAINEFDRQRRLLNPDGVMEALVSEKIKTVSLFEEGYPRLLKEIYAPPLVLFYQGSLEAFNPKHSLAVV